MSGDRQDGEMEQMRERVREAARALATPIAIVGAGCRFPGGVDDLDTYWQMLQQGTDAIVEVPPDRWDVDEYWDRDPNAPGKMYVREGGFVDDIARFDAEFFGISPREALEMDPAQRMLLEVSWQALEHAGIPADDLTGSATGVFVGLGLSDYGRRHFLSRDLDRITAYSGTGSFLSVAAGRIAYTLGLAGPAMTIDTACSSSLVAIHLAMQSLRRGETDLALAGGANTLIAPEPTVYFSALQALAKNGRCKTFDASADGYIRGEGCGIIVLKRLDDALAAGDRVLAVLKGSAINQDGHTNGLTAPSGRAQQNVIRQALVDASVSPEAVGFLEAHGTGTPLGDAVEVGAIQAAYGQARDDGSRLALGSVKTNFGHLETAAGVAGLLKVVLTLAHGEIPPHLHLSTLNPRIRWDQTPFVVNTEALPWPGPSPRIGAVSSFGLSGTNAHLVLEEPPAPPTANAETSPRPFSILPLSAHSASGLAALAERYAQALQGGASWSDLARSAATQRSHLPIRLALIAAEASGAAAALTAHAEGAPSDAPTGTAHKSAPEVVFLFSGQGSQYPGMARELYDAEPVFREALDRCAALCADHLEVPLLDVIYPSDGSTSPIHDTAYTQPALFAIEYALAQLWRSWGVEPDAVIGHSIGEYAAACIAGVFPLDAGIALVCARGRLMSALPRDGAMAAIFAPEDAVEARVAPHRDAVSVAALNHATETVISGKTEAVEAIAAAFEADGIEVRRLKVSHAFHSPSMDPILDDFATVASEVSFEAPEIPVYSNATGQPDTPMDTPTYWRDHIRGAVRFADGIAEMQADEQTVFVEIGPRPVLCGMGARIFGDTEAHWLPSLRHDRPALEQILETLGRLYTLGVEIDWGQVGTGARVPLPLYPWQGELYWLDREADGQRDPFGDWVYDVAWVPTPAPRVPEASTTWQIIGDGPFAASVRTALEAAGGTATIVDRADGDSGVVDLTALSAPTSDDPDVLAAAHEATITSALQALASGAGPVWVATRGVYGDDADLAGAPLWGLGRVAALEQPDRWGGLVDLDADASTDASANHLVATILAGDEAQVRWSDGQRLAARLTPSRRALSRPPVAIRDDGAYLVTGGFGALGRRIATWLADEGATHLVLVGRRGAVTDEAKALVARLEARGVQITAAAADVADPQAVAELLDGIALRGVFHAAGILDDALLASLDWDRFATVFAAKVLGALNLHRATSGLDLDLFVMFSSASATLGVAGQGNYAAANAFLSALARHRRTLGQPGLSVEWGPWAAGGMADDTHDSDGAQHWADQGVDLLDPDDALALLARALGTHAPSFVVAPFDWPRYGRDRPRADRLLTKLATETQTAMAGTTRTEGTTAPLVKDLAGTPPHARADHLADHLQGLVARILGFDDPSKIGLGQGFFDAGMDSLMAVELRRRLGEQLGTSLPVTVAFDHPNIEALSDYLLDEVLDLGGSAAVDTARGVGTSLDEPIAIVGASCRFPGGASSLDAFWDLLEAGVDAVRDVPADRYDVDRYFDPDPATPGKLYVRQGGFVDGIDTFDPSFFGIPPREALAMDPQQRLLLEVSWEALEVATIAPSTLPGTRTGVYVGIAASEYGRRFAPLDVAAEPDPYSGTGNESSFAAGRLAYVLGVHGPAVSLNTACSSSLVTLHLACQALRTGECDVALAGGVNAIVAPETTIQLSQIRALSPDSRCKTFDASANGYVRGEGCGMVVLKRLSDAIAAGDPIRAVVAGSSVMHDGRSSGLTVPNGQAQREVIRSALRSADVSPDQVGYLECHGTGTVLGDPVEVNALQAVFADRSADRPLALGSVKTNLGHLEAASGIAGLLKAVLILEHRQIPPHLHLQQVNPELPLDAFPVVIPTTLTPLQGNYAGISSFGLSGTNAHVVLGTAPDRAAEASATRSPRPIHFVPLSGATAAALAEQAQRLGDHLDAHGDIDIADIAISASQGRSHLSERAAVVARDREALRSGLAAVAAGDPGLAGTAADRVRIVFLCTGQGAQSAGMGRDLYETDPVFRAAMDRCVALLDPHLDLPLLSVIYGDAGDRIDDTRYTQTAMFAYEWALAELWRSWGVVPDAVIGHSSGQFVAAVLAGVMTLDTAAALMARRGNLMGDLPRDGRMVACLTTEDRVMSALAGHDDVAVAGINGPEEIVVSGRTASVDAVVAALEADGIEVRALRTSHAFHSPLMDPILDDFAAAVGDHTLSAPNRVFVENVRGEVAGDDITDPRYWADHIRGAVRFHDGIRTLEGLGYRHFVEIGNHPVLLGMAAKSMSEPGAVFTPSARRKGDDWGTMMAAVGQLYCSGATIDWSGVHTHQPGQRIALPTTAFQQDRYWIERDDALLGSGRVGDDWIYETTWVRGASPTSGPPGKTLVFCDAGGVGRGLVDRIDDVVTVTAGKRFSDKKAGTYRIDPADPAHYDRVLAATDPDRVVYLWSLDAPEVGGAGPSAAARRGVQGALYLIQAMIRGNHSGVSLVTRGAFGTDGAAADPVQRPLWGLGAAVAIEAPELGVVRIDIDPGDVDPDALRAALTADDGEDRVMLRGTRRSVARLAPATATGAPPALAEDATYWITGGLGVLGLHLAQWLADHGATHIVLSGRSAPSLDAQATLAALQADGCTVAIVRGDVSDAAEVTRMIAEITDGGHPAIRGVFHAAGTLDDGAVQNLDWDRFETVWAPKIDGAHHLHTALGDLDHFVLFSSAASMIGSAGQANYASANAFLDGLAEHRAASGQPALCVNWGPWAGGGFATDSTRDWEAHGVRPLVAGHGLDVLGRLMTSGKTRVAAISLDWDTWAGHLGTVPPFVADRISRVPTSATPAGSALVDQLRPLGVEERARRLSDHVRARTATVLGVAAAQVDPQQGFFDGGMDSLMAVELVERLQRDLDVSLPRTLAFAHGSVDAMTDHLLDEVLHLGDTPVVAVTAGPRSVDTPIAIIGMALRLPGADSPAALWDLLARGGDATSEVPADRWDVDATYDPTPATPGHSYTRRGAFVADVDQFDPDLFGITPREAMSLDPQQRLLLEVSWEALERAGKANADLATSRTGVFVGAAESDYLQRFRRAGEPFYVDAYAGSGNEGSFPAGRVSYALGLNGPAMSLNTACSSSAVSTHLACQSLRMGECEMALAGGVSLMLAPDNHIYLSQLGALAADGRCKTFDATADGYGRGEGCGMLVLRRLDDAIADGDPILAVIRGSAVNHDGPSGGLTVPNGTAQQRVIRDALANAGVDPSEISYVECHGTGTPLGDPIEVQALGAVLGAGPDRGEALALGSIKTNIGHLEQAAGVAGIAKVVLALQHRQIPAHLNLTDPNPALELDRLNLQIPTETTPWSPTARRIAGVSAFGISGTNAHMILEEAPVLPHRDRPAAPDRPVQLLGLSARGGAALRLQAEAMAGFLAGTDAALPDVVAALQRHRMPLPNRVTLTATDGADAARQLSAYAAGTSPDVREGLTRSRRPKVAFLFTGMGSQYPGMSREIFDKEPVFREALEACAAVVDPLLDGDLLAVIFPTDPEDRTVHDVAWSQVAIFAVEHAMTTLWRSWGVEADIVIGHSLGEFAAACYAGAYSLEDGLTLVAHRGLLLRTLAGQGAMYAAFAAESDLANLLASSGGEVVVAAVNAPGEVVLSGRTEAVEAMIPKLAAAGIDGRRLAVEVAFHSPVVESILDDFEARAREVRYLEPRMPIVANVTGAIATGQATDPTYWRDHLRAAVRFADGIETVIAEGYTTFVEVGPHPALLNSVRPRLEDVDDALFLPSLHRKEDAWKTLLSSAGSLWTQGTPLDWGALTGARPDLSIPAYAFHHRRYWIDAEEFPHQQSDDAADALHTVRWQPITPSLDPAGGRWVLLADRGGVASALASTLQAAGAQVEVHPTPDTVPTPEDVAVLLAGDPIARIVDFWPLDCTADDLPAAKDWCGTATLSLMQAVSGLSAAPRVVVVTRGAQQTDGAEATNPVQAMVWGFVRIAGTEHDPSAPTLVDLPGGAYRLSSLAEALRIDPTHTQVALRDQLLGPRLVPSPAVPMATPIHDDRSYLVAGLGDLAVLAAEWLVAGGARHVVLASRSGDKPDLAPRLDALRLAGATIRVLAADVTDRTSVDALLDDVRSAGPPLAGVLHTAGIIDDGLIVDQTPDRYQRVLGPKVDGAWNLHQATADDDLDLFVMYSSGAAIVGLPGQSTYASANSFLDGLAALRRSEGRPGIAVEWGPWKDTGAILNLDPTVIAFQTRIGIGQIAPATGMRALELCLGGPAVSAVLVVDWSRYLTQFDDVPPFLRDLVPRGASDPSAAAPGSPATAPGIDADDQAELIRRLLGKPVDSWPPVIEAFVQERALFILRAEPGHVLDRDTPLWEQGMDSMMTIELRKELLQSGVKLATARMLGGPSILEIGRMVVSQLAEDPRFAGTGAADAVRSASPDPDVTEFETYQGPIDPVYSHLGAAFGGAVVMAIIAFVAYQFLVESPTRAMDAQAEATPVEAPASRSKRGGPNPNR